MVNEYDPSLWPTRHPSEGEILRQMLSDQEAAWRAAPYQFTRGDQVGILMEQLAESQRLLAEARRINTMLNDQLRIQREQRQLQEQPLPQPPKAKVIKR